MFIACFQLCKFVKKNCTDNYEFQHLPSNCSLEVLLCLIFEMSVFLPRQRGFKSNRVEQRNFKQRVTANKSIKCKEPTLQRIVSDHVIDIDDVKTHLFVNICIRSVSFLILRNTFIVNEPFSMSTFESYHFQSQNYTYHVWSHFLNQFCIQANWQRCPRRFVISTF